MHYFCLIKITTINCAFIIDCAFSLILPINNWAFIIMHCALCIVHYQTYSSPFNCTCLHIWCTMVEESSFLQMRAHYLFPPRYILPDRWWPQVSFGNLDHITVTIVEHHVTIDDHIIVFAFLHRFVDAMPGSDVSPAEIAFHHIHVLRFFQDTIVDGNVWIYIYDGKFSFTNAFSSSME